VIFLLYSEAFFALLNFNKRFIMKKQKNLLTALLFGSIFLIFNQNLDAQLYRGDLNWAGAWSFGPSGSVHLDNARDLVFLGSGGSVQVIDVSDPQNPEIVNSDIRTQGLVEDIWYSSEDENLYLACGRGGFEIWDVSDYMAPERLSSVPIIYGGVEAPVEHVELYNQFAVLDCSWGYVHTVEISDPENPVQLSINGQMGNPAHDLHVDKDGYIHATGAQFYIRLLINDDGSLTNAGGHEFIYGSYEVFGGETEAYVSYSGAMYILDLTTPGFLAWSITPLEMSDVIVIDDMAYIANEDGFEIWDVSNVQSPVFVSEVSTPYAKELYINGDYAYISADRNGLYIVDISDPGNPQILSQIEGYGWAAATTVKDQIAYVAHSADGLLAIDVSDPYENGPELISAFPTEGETRDVQVKDNLAYVADWTGGLRIVDYSDPANPVELSTTPMQAWRIALGNDDVLFVSEANANNPDTLKVFDVSNPENPQFLSQFTFVESVWEIKFLEGYLYVAQYDSGLWVIDVSDPENPETVAEVELPSVLDVWVQGDVAYVASTDWEGGFVTIDIADPENPQILQIYNPMGWFHPFYVSVSGSYAYVTLNFGEVYLFDVSDPSNVVELEKYVTPGEAIQLFAAEGMLYVSDGPTGLQILKNNLITSIETLDMSADSEVSFYPNPVSHELNISIPENVFDVNIRIYNISGSLLYEENYPAISSGQQITVPESVMQQLPGGTLIWQLNASGNSYNGKLIKQ